jgi:Ca-activated chloride channel family protein
MRRSPIVPWLLIAAIGLIGSVLNRSLEGPLALPTAQAAETAGALRAINSKGESLGSCPLKHTDARVEITGILSRVTVAQRFENPFAHPIEAVYTFPLSHKSAVDDMTIRVGERTIRGVIKRREEAKIIYEQARAQGKLAALLDQERPNIFSQRVTNILPGQRIEVTISYVETLEYENGSYSFVFPMVVGRRYIPGEPVGKQGGGWSPDTDQVPDASRITPHVAPKETRAGHDLSIEVNIETGVPFTNLRSTQHEIIALRRDTHSGFVRLADKAVIPNKDFILAYDVADADLQDGLVTHRTGSDGYFMLILQPPKRITPEQVTPKELVFVLDTSGSMRGFPIKKAKETMELALDGLYPGDAFNLITFSGDTHILFPEPVRATPANLSKAKEFLASRSGSGGTEMMQAIRAALAPSNSTGHMRIVCFMTDGEVGNDLQIISEIQKHPNARVFAFGIGTSVNRFLLDGMAQEGRGAVEYITLVDDAAGAARRFHERIRNPWLTDITIEWSGLPVTHVLPQRIPDLFSAKPVVICGRYTRGGHALARLRGKSGGVEVIRNLEVPLPERESRNGVLAKLWARSRIDDLMRQDYAGVQVGTPRDDVRDAIIQLGLDQRLMTQFTSFVAVEEKTVTQGGKTRRVEVPVEMPEGVSDVEADETGVGVAHGLAGGMVMGVLPGPPAAESPGRVDYCFPAPVKRPIRVGGGIRSSKLLHRVEPIYPELAKRAQISAMVVLQVSVDEKGNVTDASVLQGHPLLNGEAVRAVKQWKYAPTLLNGVPIKLVATVTINFDARDTKLDPAIASLIERVKSGVQPDPGEKEFVRNGKAELQITVTEKTRRTNDELHDAGFETISSGQSSKLIIGRLPVEKLESLVELESVRFIAPHRVKP